MSLRKNVLKTTGLSTVNCIADFDKVSVLATFYHTININKIFVWINEKNHVFSTDIKGVNLYKTICLKIPHGKWFYHKTFERIPR